MNYMKKISVKIMIRKGLSDILYLLSPYYHPSMYVWPNYRQIYGFLIAADNSAHLNLNFAIFCTVFATDSLQICLVLECGSLVTSLSQCQILAKLCEDVYVFFIYFNNIITYLSTLVLSGKQLMAQHAPVRRH